MGLLFVENIAKNNPNYFFVKKIHTKIKMSNASKYKCVKEYNRFATRIL